MHEKSALRIRAQTVALGGSYDYIKSDRVPPGQKWHITHYAFENETGARGTFRTYIDRLGYNHYYTELQAPGAGALIFGDELFDLLEGERFVVRQASCTASDVLSLYLLGEIIYTIDGE